MNHRMVDIVPLEITDMELCSRLAAEISRTFPLSCRVVDTENLPVQALDRQRGQYHATSIIEHLASPGRNAFRLLGVVSVDIFTPILRYVFGEAMFPGKAAVVSTYRLGIALKQEKPSNDRDVFIDRVIKEGIHEIGHTFGLTHCNDRNCVMAASLDINQIDSKSTQLCSYCRFMLEDDLKS